MESLILRAVRLLGWMTGAEAAQQLIDTGASREDAVLAVQAAMTWERLR